MATLQIRIDDMLRQRASDTALAMGMDLSTAIRMFLTQMVKENALPFHPTNDPFYSVSNREALHRSLHQMQTGNSVTVTLEQLEEMEKADGVQVQR